MLMRFDPFRDFDRLTEGVLTNGGSRPAMMAMDAYRDGDHVTVHFDLPGVDADTIDLTVEKNQLSVKAERRWERSEDHQVLAAERPQGGFTRQLFLGDGLDPDRIEADYHDGVLTVTIPVAETAKPRRISVGGGQGELTS